MQRAKLQSSAEDVRALSGRDLAFEQVYTCGAGQVSFTVDPYGQMQMCQLSRKAVVRPRARGASPTVWGERFGALRARAWQTASACRTCNLQPLCGSCPGAAELEHGDIEAQVAHFCEIAHLRARRTPGRVDSGHRADATCCLGSGSRTALPVSTGCGGCGHRETAPALMQIERRRPPA